MNAESQPRYVEPTRGTAVFNTAVARLTRMGISVYGSRVLAVRGRKSGEWRTTPVNPLTLDGERYLIAPRGNTQWVRNMRVAGGGELRVGRRVEKFTATEVPVQDRPRVLRAYHTEGQPIGDPKTLERLAVWQAASLHGGRTVTPQNLHVTLAFLGSRAVSEVRGEVGVPASEGFGGIATLELGGGGGRPGSGPGGNSPATRGVGGS